MKKFNLETLKAQVAENATTDAPEVVKEVMENDPEVNPALSTDKRVE